MSLLKLYHKAMMEEKIPNAGVYKRFSNGHVRDAHCEIYNEPRDKKLDFSKYWFLEEKHSILYHFEHFIFRSLILLFFPEKNQLI